MQKLFQDLSKKGLSTQKIHDIIVKAVFINTVNKDCLDPIHMQKCYFHAAAVIKQTTFISMNEFNNWNIHYNDHCQTCKTVKLLSKNVIGLQKINKTNKKHFGVHPTS